MSAGWTVDPTVADNVLRQLRSAKHVLMPTHQNVDADGLGSPLALLHALDTFGVQASVVISDGQPPQSLSFLPGYDRVLIYGKDELPDYDMLCMIDCSDRRRLGEFYSDDPTRVDGSTPIVNIDHHVTNDLFGIVNLVEPVAASAAEIVTDVIGLWEVPITTPIAQCLLTGIYGDTLGLRTEATTSRTMRTAADLVDAGANPVPIVDALFRVKPRSSICLWEHALRRVEWTGSLIWTELTEETFTRCRASRSEAEGMVNFLVGTEGSSAAAIPYANEKGWRVSLRSLPSDVDV